MKIKILIFIIIVSFIINASLIYKLYYKNKLEIDTRTQLPFLSKRIFIEDQNDILINFIPLRAALREYVGKQGDKVGVYFEYLPSGVSIGINDKEEIKLVSLSKIPVAMSILKKVEQKQLSLDDIFTIEKKHLDKGFGNLWKQGEGAKVSVEKLIQLSLTESDNTAYRILFDQLTSQEINEVYESLDIMINKAKEEDKIYPLVSPKNYSSIFRSLYLSSFLLKENSNYLLNILTQTIFKDKIVAGVPANVNVAHKIGVFDKFNSPQNVFADCGIIYVPNRPYILCTFVQDTNEQAQKHISYISKMIYEYVSKVASRK